MKLWQRPHVIAAPERWRAYCVECGSNINNPNLARAKASDPCPARTVRLSDNPAAVRMLKAFASLLPPKPRRSQFSTEFEWMDWTREYDRLRLAIRMAVRAYWSEP